MDLDAALGEFDAAETTLRRLETVWERLRGLTPAGMVFSHGSPEDVEYEGLQRVFAELAAGLPAIEGWRITASPLDLNAIAQARFDANEVGFLEAKVEAEDLVEAPGVALREYRFRFNRARRQLVRERLNQLIPEIESRLVGLVQRVARDSEPINDPEWERLVEAIREVDRLVGSSTGRKGRWGELRRHTAWAQGVDLHDIAEHDWPSVAADIRAGVYDSTEPLPVHVNDLAELVATRPAGRVATELVWRVLDAEGFERLLFNILGDADGYENVQWPTRTNAPDRGRDITADRVFRDALSRVERQRVIVQCRHWQRRSIAAADLERAVAQAKLADPDALIIATSGRFTTDAVDWIDKHNGRHERPAIEPWPESHLESLLASRPDLIAEFGLRPKSA